MYSILLTSVFGWNETEELKCVNTLRMLSISCNCDEDVDNPYEFTENMLYHPSIGILAHK